MNILIDFQLTNSQLAKIWMLTNNCEKILPKNKRELHTIAKSHLKHYGEGRLDHIKECIDPKSINFDDATYNLFQNTLATINELLPITDREANVIRKRN